jgi:hypothetical protein
MAYTGKTSPLPALLPLLYSQFYTSVYNPVFQVVLFHQVSLNSLYHPGFCGWNLDTAPGHELSLNYC